MRKATIRFSLTFMYQTALIVMFAMAARAQVDPTQNTGFPINGVFQGGAVDTVQLNNGNLHIELPIWSTQGRGSGIGLKYLYDSRAWEISGSCDEFGNCNDSVTLVQPGMLSGKLQGPGGGSISYELLGSPCNGTNYIAFANFMLYDENNTVHHFFPNEVDPPNDPCKLGITSLYADDGSGWMMKVDPTGQVLPTAYRKDGVKMGGGSAIVEDSNGNQVNFANIYTTGGSDTLGRTIYADGSYFDSSGTRRYVQFGYTDVPVHTSLCQWDPNPGYCSEYSNTWHLISTITLPNGLIYTINYVPNSFGQPSSITLPSGGQISYTWTTGDPGGPIVATRTVVAGGSSAAWTYQYWTSLGNPAHVAKITDPAGNDTSITHVFAFPGFIGQMQYFAGSSTGGTLLKTVNTDYSTSQLGKPPIRVTTTWNQQNLVSKVETDWDDGTIQLGATTHFTWGNPIALREYGWGSGGPGSLVRSTSYSYLHLQNSNYKTANIADRTTATYIRDGSGNLKAQTLISYDGSTPTATSGVPNHDYTNFSSSNLIRGNRTQISRWLDTTSTWLSTTNTFDDLGNLRSTIDPLSHTTTYDYTDNFTDGTNHNAQAFVTRTTLPVTSGFNHVERKQFYWYTSLVAATCGQNFPSASVCTNTYSPPQSDYAKVTFDSTNRPSTVTQGDGGITSYSYNDTTLPLSVSSTSTITGSLSAVRTKVFDGLGRLAQTQVCEDGAGCSKITKVDTTYDTIGRVATVTNPYRSTSDPTYGITTTQYDALGRLAKVIPPDGSQASNNISTSYSGNCSTATDQAGKARKSCWDALGRLSQVFEDPGGLNYETDYTYDVLDNLTNVVQAGSRQRTFTYNSLSQLTSATNPESGTINYTYNNDGLLLTKVAPAPNQTGSATVTTCLGTWNGAACDGTGYDALHRVTQKSYSDGTTPTAYFLYDVSSTDGVSLSNTVGRLVRAHGLAPYVGVISNYDPLGRVISQWQWTPQYNTSSFVTSYTYDFGGDMTSYSNGVGVTFTQSFDAAGRATGLTSSLVDAQHPANLATVNASNGFSPAGGIQNLSYGSGMLESRAYNNRLQLTELKVQTPGGFVRYDFTYGYTDASGHNNGNVMSWNSTGWDFAFTRAYTYDALNRLSTLNQSSGNAATCTSAFSLSWTYDAWGNRTDQNLTSGSCYAFHAAATSLNRLYDPVNNIYQYDAAGNLTYDGSHSYTYDAANRVTKVDSGNTATYAYDANGRRVEKTIGSTKTDYVYDLRGSVVAEWCTNCGGFTGWARGYAYLDGQDIAQYADSTTYFIHKDHLGSTRLMTKLDQSGYDYMDYLPFGEQIGGSSGTSHKFVGKERDAESGLDNFGARYDASTLGRFMTPDWSSAPEPIPFADLSNPQSLNLYAYVENNPINRLDDGGHAGKEKLAGTNYSVLKHRDNPNDMPNIHVFDKKGNEVGQLRFNGRGESSWDPAGLKNLGSSVRQQVEGVAREGGYAQVAIERQAAMDAARAARGARGANRAVAWMILIDMALNTAYVYKTQRDEATTGWHYDALRDTNVITDVDKAAKSFAVGSQITTGSEYTHDLDVYTLGSDGKWRDKQGHYLFNCEVDGRKGICSSKDMA